MRVALTIAYNGTHFLGSQTQKSSTNTILGKIEMVLSAIGIKEKLVASGRTDKGVHASRQVCHVDLPSFWNDIEKLKKVLNQMLPNTIEVKSIKEVDAEFHARYDAKTRVYRYIIKKEKSNPFTDDIVTFDESVEFEKVQKNIKIFIGEHDFKHFMKTGSDTKSSVRTIYKAFAYRYKGYIILNFEANGFLRSQIRLMVAALLKFNKTQIENQLNLKEKYPLKPAKSNGLYLAKIKYINYKI